MTERADSLAALSIAVTRPLRQSDALVARLRTRGASVGVIPLLAIAPVDDAAQRVQVALHTLRAGDIAIFASQNAVEQLLLALAALDEQWPQGVTVLAVGSATADYLTREGIAATSPAQMDSEGLLALPPLQAVSHRRCVIFRGCGGRETMASTLRARGAQVSYCELYQRVLPEAAAVQWQQWWHAQPHHAVAIACINSTETLHNLLRVDADATARANLTLVVPGERVAQCARDAGFTHVLTACDATDNSIFDTITQYKKC